MAELTPDQALVPPEGFGVPATAPAPTAPRKTSAALKMALISAVSFVALIGAATQFLGSASDGSPAIWFSMKPFTAATSSGGGLPRTAFSTARSFNGNLVADPALIEDAVDGPLPTIAADKRMPLTVYARAVDKNDKRPKIAVVIGGLDVSAAETADALMQLPPQITLGFLPFAHDAQAWVDKARSAGHEVLLQVPMEPFDFPDSDPGPHILLVAASSEENDKRLLWAMSRFTGYVGITNLLGGRFLGESGAIEPMLANVTRRGLMFLDDGTNSSSLASTAARHVKTPYAKGTILLDDIQSQAAIDTKLAELEEEARDNGKAIGVASLYPISVARIAEWAQGAAQRGFAVVPISAMAEKLTGDTDEPQQQADAR